MAQTATEWAQAHGVSVRQARFLFATGQVPGATRTGSPGSTWVVMPVNASTPVPEGNGGGADTSPLGSVIPDLSTTPGQSLTLLLATLAAVQGLTTRPARALTPTLTALTLTTQRHAMNRDGACHHCGWTWPCPDYSTAMEGLTAAHATIVDGAL